MKVCGIVTEYNPFHNGHLHHIKEAKRITNCDVLVNVMSGNFVQRGEPAIIDKWTRAETAIQNGCDLVVELPLPYAIQSAKQFAYGAIETLKLLQVDEIVFGSETNDIEMLSKIANMDADAFKDLLKDGLSPVKAYEMIHGHLFANDILGIHYIQALHGTHITPHCIKRTNHYHEEALDDTFASATAIRKAMRDHQDVSSFTPMNFTPHDDLSAYYSLIRHLLITTPPKTLKGYKLMDEGIESWLIKHTKANANYDNFLNACVSKRYTASRIRRTLLHLLLQIERVEYPINHVRVLAFNAKGKALLKALKGTIPLVTKFSQLPSDYRILYEKSAYLYAHSETEETQSKEWQSAHYL